MQGRKAPDRIFHLLKIRILAFTSPNEVKWLIENTFRQIEFQGKEMIDVTSIMIEANGVRGVALAFGTR